MKAMICANLSKDKSARTAEKLCEELLKLGFQPMFCDELSDRFDNPGVLFAPEEELLKLCDIIITVGGDGTILKWGRKAAMAGKPLLGINTGRLGFMATLESDELYKLSRLSTGDYTVSRRMLLDVYHNDNDKYMAINDVVLSKSRYTKLPEFSVKVGEFEVTRIRADGIIFSTPTGSTAYSLSAGGPIIQPDAQCIEFTPLCAHSLFGRPMIFSAGSDITVTFSGYENTEVVLCVDGDDGIMFVEGDILKIKKSQLVLSLIDINGGSFYDSVHNKLMRPLK